MQHMENTQLCHSLVEFSRTRKELSSFFRNVENRDLQESSFFIMIAERSLFYSF